MKSLIKLVLVGLLAVSSLNAKEILFDLRAQDFSNAVKQEQKMTKYKISDKIILETNANKSSKGYYYTANNIKGLINIEVNKKISNWKYNLDITYHTYFENKKRLIIFTDKFGENIILEFYKKGFTINGKEYKANTNKEHMLISIKKESTNLSISINSQKIYTSTIEFDNLKFINTEIMFDNEYHNAWDRLNNILLVSND